MSLSRMYVYDRDQESKTLKEKLGMKLKNIPILECLSTLILFTVIISVLKPGPLTPRFNMKGCNKRVLAC